jgi:hypothetical protein
MLVAGHIRQPVPPRNAGDFVARNQYLQHGYSASTKTQWLHGHPLIWQSNSGSGSTRETRVTRINEGILGRSASLDDIQFDSHPPWKPVLGRCDQRGASAEAAGMYLTPGASIFLKIAKSTICKFASQTKVIKGAKCSNKSAIVKLI